MTSRCYTECGFDGGYVDDCQCSSAGGAEPKPQEYCRSQQESLDAIADALLFILAELREMRENETRPLSYAAIPGFLERVLRALGDESQE